MSDERRRAADRENRWMERGLLAAATAVLSLLVWVFEGVPDQLQQNQRATELLTYQTKRLTDEVKELNDLRGRQVALEKSVEHLDKRVDRIEERRFMVFPPTGKK